MAKRKTRRGPSVWGVIGTILLICVLAAVLFLCIFAVYIKTCIVPNTKLDLSDYALNQSSKIFCRDSEGEWVELTSLHGQENRVWVDYEDIPKYMEKALVSIEDKRFYTHHGVDWYRTAGAFVNMFVGMKNTFGGSTITQQLIKNLTQQDDITVQRKLLEIFQALQFEKDHSKQEIIEWYLNAVYFGEGCYGVQTAAQTYFGKNVEDLSLAECAAIVGITNLPTFYDPFYSVENNKARQENILWCMLDQGYITKSEYDAAMKEELVFVRGENEPVSTSYKSYYVETVISDVVRDLANKKGISQAAAERLVYNAGYSIYCCIDTEIQAKVDAVYENLDALPQTTGSTDSQLQSGIVVMDQYTGEIKALSGGTGKKNRDFGLNRATDTTRPPGSSIKPIAVYGPAVEYGLISPSTLVLDANSNFVKLKHAPDNWYPANSPNTYDGIITILTALQESKNTVSAQIMDKLTPKNSLDFLRTRLGVTSLIDEDEGYAALALGEPHYGITVREMAQAYCALANDGTFTYARTYTMVKDSNGETVLDNQPVTQTAFSTETARTMTYMLNNAATNGTGYESRLKNMPVAGKTGTTTNKFDRWFCGYTPYYTCAVWTGYDTPEKMYFNGNPATQIWQKVMASIHEGLEHKDFNMSYGGSATGIFGTREELEEQAMTEEQRKAKEEEEARKKAEEEAKNNEENNSGDPILNFFNFL